MIRAVRRAGISFTVVIPAQAGIQGSELGACGPWTPAFAGVTGIVRMEGWKFSLVCTSSRASETARCTPASLDIPSRVWQHKENLVRGFTKKYGVHRLVYIEFHDTMPEAIRREKQIKEWKRAWKLQLIESANPTWRDLYDDIWR